MNLRMNSILCAVCAATAVAVAETPTIRILPFGDSITYGASANQVNPSFTGGYRKPLYNLLTQAGYSVEFVGTRTDNSGGMESTRHEGYPGYRISNWYNLGAAGIYETMWDTFTRIKNPHIILLHIGTNDIGDNHPNEPGYSVGKMGELLDRLIAFEPGADIVVSTLMRRATESKQTYITTKFNPALRTLVASYGSKVHLLDLEDCLDPENPEDLSDDVHPTEGGYQKMAARWFDAVTNIVTESWTPNNEIAVLYPVTNATTTSSIVLKMNAEMDATSVADASHYTLDGAPVASASLAGDLHTITVNFTAPVTTDTTHNLVVSGLANAEGTATLAAKTVPFEVSARGAVAHVPSGDLAGYRRVATYDFPQRANLNAVDADYADDIRDRVDEISRIGYYIELRETGGSLRWLWVSMDAFTQDPRKIGVPTFASGAFFDCYVSNLVIRSNAPGITPGERDLGNIEFFPGNYSYDRGSFQLPNGSASLGDFDDAPSISGGQNTGNFGSMQIHDFQNRTTLFSWTRWSGYLKSTGDGAFTYLGLGNAPSGNLDWTYTGDGPTPVVGSARTYDIRRMEIYVKSDNTNPPLPCPASQTTIRIMPLGDSITWGYDQATGSTGGYRAPLYDLLTQAGYNIEFCGSQTGNSTGMASPKHEGHSGYRISNNYCPDQNGLLENLSSWFADANCKNPHIVLLHIGTNDANTDPNDLKTHGLENLGLLIDRISEYEPGAEIVVSTLLERDYRKNGTDHSNVVITNWFNPHLPALVLEHAQKGQRVHFFDISPYVPLADLGDGCHPNATGYQKMAQGWFDCITNLVPLTSLFVPDDTPAMLSFTPGAQSVTFVMNQTMGADALNPEKYRLSVPGISVTAVSQVGRALTVQFSAPIPSGQEVTLHVKGLPNEAGTFATLSREFTLVSAHVDEVADGGLAVGRDTRVEVDVAADATQEQMTPITQEGSSRILKTGDGTWKLPLTAFRQKGAFDIGVRDGTLELEKGALNPSYTKPTAILNQACFWISAKNDAGAKSASLVTTNGADGALYVARWCDERETNVESPTRYFCLPDWSYAAYTSLRGVPPTYELKDGRASVYCGGYSSGKFLAIQKGGDYGELTGIREIFCVHGVFKTYGYLLGNHAGTHAEAAEQKTLGEESHDNYVNTATASFNGSSSIWRVPNQVPGPYRDGWTYLDGEFVPNPSAQRFAAGFHLFSVKSGRTSGALGGFFTNRHYHERQGGDYLNECIVFTNELSVAQRVQVTQYLLQKWGIAPEAGALCGRVEIAEGATLKASSDDGTFAAVDFSGAGTVVKTGTGATTLGDLSAFRGSLRVEAGSVLATHDEEIAYAPAAGERVSTGVGFPGETLSTVADAGVGKVRLTGAGGIKATSVADDVSELAVEGGTLVLSVPQKAPYGALAPGRDPVVTNGTFEANTGNKWTKISDVNGRYGWYATMVNANFWGVDGEYPFKLEPYMADDNRWFLNLQDNGLIVYTYVAIPASGIYELSFDACGRENYDRYLCTVLVGTSVNSLEDVARFKTQRLGPFVRAAYKIPFARAGTYVVAFKSQTTGSMGATGGGALFDNVRLDFCSETEDPSVWKIPNGDFELLTNVQSANGSSSIMSIQNTASNWVFDNAGYTGNSDPYVGVLVHGMGNVNGYSYYQPTYLSEQTDRGIVQLFFGDTNGAARTTFRPPAGTWKLRADTAICPLYFRGNWQWQRTSDFLSASVTIGGVTTALGKLTVNTSPMASSTWPTAFTVDGNTEVTLELRQTDYDKGSLLADNFVLVRAGLDENLLRDGGFETVQQSAWNAEMTPDDCWRGAQNNVGQKYSYVYPVTASSYYPTQIGATVVDGTRYLIVVGTGSAEQNVTFPEAGLYKLTLHTANRIEANHAYNPIKTSIYPCGGSTNDATVIGLFPVNATNFVKRTAYFRVPTAGDYTFRLEGTVTEKNSDKLSRVDAVSIVKADDLAAEAPSVPEKLQLSVAAGAKLRLDYPGTIKVDHLRLGGRSVTGTITAAKYPDFLSGPGTIEIMPKCTFLIFR